MIPAMSALLCLLLLLKLLDKERKSHVIDFELAPELSTTLAFRSNH